MLGIGISPGATCDTAPGARTPGLVTVSGIAGTLGPAGPTTGGFPLEITGGVALAVVGGVAREVIGDGV